MGKGRRKYFNYKYRGKIERLISHINQLTIE